MVTVSKDELGIAVLELKFLKGVEKDLQENTKNNELFQALSRVTQFDSANVSAFVQHELDRIIERCLSVLLEEIASPIKILLEEENNNEDISFE